MPIRGLVDTATGAAVDPDSRYYQPGGNAGTPSAINLTNGTGLPSSGISDSTATGRSVLTAADAAAARAAIGAAGLGGSVVFSCKGSNASKSAPSGTLVYVDDSVLNTGATVVNTDWCTWDGVTGTLTMLQSSPRVCIQAGTNLANLAGTATNLLLTQFHVGSISAISSGANAAAFPQTNQALAGIWVGPVTAGETIRVSARQIGASGATLQGFSNQIFISVTVDNE